MNSPDINQAATFLRKELSPNLIQQFRSTPINEIEQHFGLGMTIRNILRRSDIRFDDVWLDDHWLEILLEAMKHE